VIRGGDWYCYASFCRSALRTRYYPDLGEHDLGFRVLLALGQ